MIFSRAMLRHHVGPGEAMLRDAVNMRLDKGKQSKKGKWGRKGPKER